MALGRAGRPFARLVAGAWLVSVWLLVLCGQQTAIAAPGDYLESFGPDGTAGTEFARPAGLAVDQETGAVYVADSETQVLYKFDASGEPLAYGGSGGNISGNELTGFSFNGFSLGRAQVAIDSSAHVVYVTSADKVMAFEPNGEPHNFTEGLGAGTNVLPESIEAYGVAVDDVGNIYVSDNGEGKVRIYSRQGAVITAFEPSVPGVAIQTGTLAVASDGTVYVTDVQENVYAFEPTKFPVTGKTTYGVGERVQEAADSFAVSIAIDPATQYVYIGEFCSEGGCARIGVYDELGNFVRSIGADGPGALEGLPAGIGINGESEKVYAAVRGAGAADLSQVAVFSSIPIPMGPPTIKGLTVTSITSTSATLQALVNPNTLETSYWFEYGVEDCAEPTASCTKVPSDAVAIGSGHLFVPVSVSVDGLDPGTKYFFRIVAENEAEDGLVKAATRSFTTQIGNLGFNLTDDRVWEQVTPVGKSGGVMTNAGLLQAAADGNGIAFQARGSLVGRPDGNRALEPSATLAQRGSSGWGVTDLVPPHSEASGLGFGPEYKIFSTDLGQALLEPRDDTPLSPEFSERAPTLRTNSSPPSYRPLVTTKEGFANVPPGTIFGGEANGARNPVSVSAANGPLTHVVISSEEPLIDEPEEAEKRSIYLWSDGVLKPVSELPNGEIVTAQPGSGVISVRHAVSEDGGRVFWAPGDPLASVLEWPALYLRDTVAEKTSRIDLPVEGASEEGEPHPAFMTANADGSVVFFTDSQQLTEDASPTGRDLYRCEIGNVEGSLGCVDLEDLSAPLAGSGESGEAEELAVGVSEDGKSIYFAAKGVLDPSPNMAGETAASGVRNLYLWREGIGVRFIASLSDNDSPDWGALAPNEVGHGSRSAAASSPSGRYLAFMSDRNLAGAETNDPATGEAVEQAFLYDSVADQLVCISCNPSGATDQGHKIIEAATEGGVIFPDPQQLWSGKRVGVTLPEASEGEPTAGFSLYWPRTVLDNGRAYFNSISPLVTGDSNGTWDVYQYEPFDVGNCSPSAGNGGLATTETGCVALISSGTHSRPSLFMDSSTTGDDVFFASFARLSALDTDDVVDIYDARVDGVEAIVDKQTECVGEACQPRGLPPVDQIPNSSSFSGAGDIKHAPRKHCKKGQRKVKRSGKTRCVKAKKKQHKLTRSKGKA